MRADRSAASSLNVSPTLSDASNIFSSDQSSTNSFMAQSVKKNVFTVALINARSLKNKMNSLNKTLNELGADVTVITETWFKPSDESINCLLEDFKHKTGYNLLRKDRRENRRGGGLAIYF